jgi:hypothetical protein
MKLFWSFFATVTAGVMLLSPKAMATSAPLPTVQEVMPKVLQASANENTQYHAFNNHYSYRRERTTAFYDFSGGLKSFEDKASTNTPNPSPVALLTRNDPPAQRVSASHRQVEQSSGPSIHGVPLGKKEDLLNPDIIRRFNFTIVGREVYNGRPTLIVDFKPASTKLPVLNIKDRFINSMAGSALIDEQDDTLVKADIHLMQKVSILDGAAGTVYKFTFSFSRERTPDGYWFSRDMNWHLEAQEATYRRIIVHDEKITGVQKKM